jgi:NADH-quinone oxidoreductase subunit L
MLEHLWLIPILPLAGAVVNLLLGLGKARKGLTNIVGVGSVGAATVAAFVALWEYLNIPVDALANPTYRAHLETYFTWIHADNLTANASFQLDPLSAVMLFFVTFVGFLIHLYSVGYMHDECDSAYARYFAYLNLFMFSMLVLVLGSNLPLMFVGWEGVGLCSYLLIGFYFEKDWCAAAGKKAFVVNRIGDLGFILAIFVTFATFGSGEFLSIFPEAAANPDQYAGTATVIALLLFVGAVGKSAQLPLYVWLPDAMAGPTPVSALIHAATMVTAGVYMVVRCNVLFRLSPVAMLVVAIVGGLTAIFAATIGIAQNDIKKVLAYSTVSQLGYMFLGAGAFGFVAAIFHVLTHAFFKACLFLGSGSVIHACGGEQDMRKMGGLRKHMPITYWTFLAATIAIAGVPFFAGFFSKDEILAKVFEVGHGGGEYALVYMVLWGLALAGAALTAFYMFRLVSMTFWGEFRGGEEAEHHLHESPWTMTVPLIILGFLSFAGGYIGLPGKLWHKPEHNLFEHFLAPILPDIHWAAHAEHAGHVSLGLEWGLVGLSVLVAVSGIVFALWFYARGNSFARPEAVAAKLGILYRTVLNKYYVDEIYDATVIRPLHRFAMFCWRIFDTWVIDGTVNMLAFLTEILGDFLRYLQTGNVRNYALSVALGILALAVILW